MALLPEKTVKDKAMELTSIEYETELLYPENYGMTAGNFDGQGISHGCIQFPLGWGTLQGIWKDLYTNYFDMVKSKFTVLADFTSWEDWLLNKTIQQQIDHADITWTDWKLDGNGDRIPESGHNVKEPWKTYFRNLGITNESQLRQQQEVDVIYHPNALKWFKDFGLWTRRGYALMFDISVQNGSINPLDVNDQPIDVMGRIFARFAALNTTGLTAEEIETEKMKLIVEERAKEVSSTWRLSYTERKSSIALGEFYLTTYGKTVSTVPYDMILEPAFAGYTKADIYVATSGDSFASIGQQYNTTAAKIQEMNPQVVDTNIYTGLSFNVPYQEAEIIGANAGSYFRGTTKINQIFLGTTPIDKIFAGSFLVYTPYVEPVIPTTTISPASTVQNTIPFTVSLSTDEVGATIYYKLGTGAEQIYAGVPFSVNQDSVGVNSTDITVTYWAVGANGTEAQKTITYDTSGAIPAKPVATTISANWYARVNWTATANTTSYSVYRSTTAGTIGELLIDLQTFVGFDDETIPENDVTYYYTVRASNYGNFQDSDQVTATPSAAPSAPSITWINGQNVNIAQDGLITKTGGGDAWNAGADSTEQFDGTTDAIIEYIPASTEVRIAFGFDEVADGIEAYRNKDIDWNWEINPSGLNEITVNEVKKYAGTYAANDVFRVALESGIIRFYQNGNLMFENTDPITFPIVTDVAMYLQGATFKAELSKPAPAPSGWRYVRVQGYGDQTSGTTRIVELRAMEGATNRLQGKLPISGEATNAGNIAVATDGAVVHASGYPLWWSGAGIPNLIYDLGAQYPIDTLTYIGYSPAVDPRQTKFKMFVSNDNVNWTDVIDYSLNTTTQTVDGFSFAVV